MTEHAILTIADAFEPAYRRLFKLTASKASEAYAVGGKAGVMKSLKSFRDQVLALMNKNHMVAFPHGMKSVVVRKRTKAKKPKHITVSNEPTVPEVAKIAADFLKQNKNRANEVANTTLDLARQSVAAGIEQGLGPAQIAQLIQDTVGGSVGAYRARMIARTETTAAFNFANLETVREMEESTGTLMKVWVAATDERVRESHADADGQAVTLDGTFSVGSDQLSFPGDPSGSAEEIINCRCTMVYEPQD